MKTRILAAVAVGCMFLPTTVAVAAQQTTAGLPWMDSRLDADRRAAALLGQMTQDEKLTLLRGFFGTDFSPKNFTAPKEAREGSAGYVPGIPRLGIPPQWQTDAGIGVATQGGAKQKRERTALPSGMATAATWNPDLAFKGGAMIGAEARASGFNVMLAGGVNLVREPRNGRNFEYGGEDPLLAGIMVGSQIAGIESNHIISTVKHHAFNNQETGRNIGNVLIDRVQGRMSELLAFQIAIERSNPGAVMCAYNKVDGDWACENSFLLTDVLRRDWGWKGYVMSDWGAVHSTAKAANSGLDQQSGYPFDDEAYFGEPLKRAVAAGDVSPGQLDLMVRRILRTMFDKGLFDHPVAIGPIDFQKHAAVTRSDAEEGAVLLKNDRAILPLSSRVKSIAIIGSHADKGVLSGGGSSQVYPIGGNAVPGLDPTGWPGPVVYYPSSPMKAIQAQAPNARISFESGKDAAAAAKLAAASEIAIVFVNQWTSEASDYSLTLPDNQDALVSAVAAANPRTVVVLQTGGAVFMPWIAQVPAALEAWYPGTAGGEAIANLLFGKVNPSGHLPITFPRDESQFVRARIDGTGMKPAENFDIRYDEGAAVGYKWFDAKKLEPLFPFGHGLSYTSFAYSDLETAIENGEVTASFTVRNTGPVRGMDVPQLYVAHGDSGWEAPKRLAGWQKVDLKPGEAATVKVKVDPRLLAVFDDGRWEIEEGEYRVLLGASSRDIKASAAIRLPERALPVSFRP